ncbi:MAG: carbamoyl-phosphate synthase small subunit, partial [Rickettsiales bacterium]
MNISTSKNAALVFSNGEIIRGFGIGKPNNTTIGEICFNTAITGYQEILTDPSYSGQIINFTFPHIGNVGVNDDDIESQIPKVKGLIIRETITNSGNYRAKGHLNDWLIKYGITGICSVDTRQITKNIRDGGGKNVAIIFDENLQDIDFDKIIADLKQNEDLKGVELASSASLNKKYEWSSEGKWDQEENKYNQISDKKLKVVAIDYGAKLNILRCLTEAGIEVVVVPA